MADISKIKIGSTEYDIKDATARSMLNSALIFKGTLYISDSSKGSTSKATFEALTNYKAGWCYIVGEAGTYAGLVLEPGDMLVANTSCGGTFTNSEWTAIQSNLVNGLFRGTNSLTNKHILIADGTGGQVASAAVTYDKANANTGNNTGTVVTGVSVATKTSL